MLETFCSLLVYVNKCLYNLIAKYFFVPQLNVMEKNNDSIFIPCCTAPLPCA